MVPFASTRAASRLTKFGTEGIQYWFSVSAPSPLPLRSLGPAQTTRFRQTFHPSKKPSETSLQSNLPVRPWFHLVPLSCSCPRVPPKRYFFVLQLAKHILRINMKMNRVGGRATRNSKHAAQRVYVVIRRPAVGVRKGQMALLCF